MYSAYARVQVSGAQRMVRVLSAPAESALQEGDVIIALDGALLTAEAQQVLNQPLHANACVTQCLHACCSHPLGIVRAFHTPCF